MSNIYKRFVTYFSEYQDKWVKKSLFFNSRQTALEFDVSKSEWMRSVNWTTISAPVEANVLPDHFTITALRMIE